MAQIELAGEELRQVGIALDERVARLLAEPAWKDPQFQQEHRAAVEARDLVATARMHEARAQQAARNEKALAEEAKA